MQPNRIEEILVAYDELVGEAQRVAQKVLQLRYPQHSIAPFFEISFSENRKTVSAGYYWRSSNETDEFPVAYLWATSEQIETMEKHRADQQERKLQQQREEAEAKRADAERAQYLRLKEKYELAP